MVCRKSANTEERIIGDRKMGGGSAGRDLFNHSALRCRSKKDFLVNYANYFSTINKAWFIIQFIFPSDIIICGDIKEFPGLSVHKENTDINCKCTDSTFLIMKDSLNFCLSAYYL